MVSEVCSERATLMLKRNSGFGVLVKVNVSHLIVTHCVLHRHAMIAKTLPRKLAEVSKIEVECVNYERNSFQKHRILKELNGL